MRAIVTIGLPGCGKSTWAATKGVRGAVIIERDACRAQIAAAEGNRFSWATWNVAREPEVHDIWAKALDEAITTGRDLVIADTNINHRHRRELAARLLSAGYKLRYVLFDVPEEVCRERNARRGTRAVPPEAYDRLRAAFQQAREGLPAEAAESGIERVVVR